MILLKGGLVVDPESETTRIADVLIEDGVIRYIGNIDIDATDNSEEVRIVDCEGLIVEIGRAHV